MTIAQALKEKNKKVAKIQKLWSRISSYNSVVEGSEKPYNISMTWDSYNAEITELINLKTQIHSASSPVRADIFLLSELKAMSNNVRALNTTSGRYRDRYADDMIEMEAHFGLDWKDARLEEFEAKIEEIQERLDTFNHTHHI